MADEVYPVTLYNPQRPNAGFSLMPGGDQYLTPTGDYIFYDALMQYILTGTGVPSAADVTRAQTLLNGLYSSYGDVVVSGTLDSKTAARISEFQQVNGML